MDVVVPSGQRTFRKGKQVFVVSLVDGISHLMIILSYHDDVDVLSFRLGTLPVSERFPRAEIRLWMAFCHAQKLKLIAIQNRGIK